MIFFYSNIPPFYFSIYEAKTQFSENIFILNNL